MPELQAGIWPPPELLPPQPAPPLNHSGIPTNQGKLGQEAALNFTEVGDGSYGYKEHFADGDIKATRHFDVPWGNRLAFVQYMMGYTINTVSAPTAMILAALSQPIIPPLPPTLAGVVGTLSRIIPAQHPQLPHLYVSRVELVLPQGATADDPNVVAVDAANAVVLSPQLGLAARPGTDPAELAQENILVAGAQLPAGFPAPPADLNRQIVQRLQMIRYYDSSTGKDGLARYAVTYSVMPFEVRDDNECEGKFKGIELCRYVEREYTYAASNLPIPAGVLVFQGGPFNGQPIGQLGNILIMGTMQLRYIWHQVPDIPHAFIQQAIGSVNKLPFDGYSGWPAFAPGTLLCLAPTQPIKRYRTATGRIAHDVAYNFVFRQQGWNSFPASDGQFYPVVNKTSNQPPYGSSDFSNLFIPPLPLPYQ